MDYNTTFTSRLQHNFNRHPVHVTFQYQGRFPFDNISIQLPLSYF